MADETLRRTLDTLAERLQADVERHVRTALEELAATAAPPAAMPLTEVSPLPAETPSPTDTQAPSRLNAAIQSIGAARSLSEVLDRLADGAAAEASRAAVVIVRGRTLKAWRLAGFVATPESLDVPWTSAGIIGAAVQSRSVVADPLGENTPLFAGLAGGVESIAVPLTLSGDVVAVLYADRGPSNPEPRTRNPVPGTLNPAPLEILARYAARCLEVVTAFTVARSLAHPDAPAGSLAPGAPGAPDAPGDADVAARRYARLLISEIKLYHEPDVMAGRQERDLLGRLGGEIARARSLYEERIPSGVRQRTDYFHEELVRTLANGDASLLAGTGGW